MGSRGQLCTYVPTFNVAEQIFRVNVAGSLRSETIPRNTMNTYIDTNILRGCIIQRFGRRTPGHYKSSRRTHI